MKYNTRHKLQILKCFQEHAQDHLTVEQLRSLLNGSVPLATIYRIVDNLVEEGFIHKYVVDQNAPACYQLSSEDCQNHFHLLCTGCGKVIHLNCHEVDHLISHIESEHGFSVDISRVNFYGKCSDCMRKEQR